MLTNNRESDSQTPACSARTACASRQRRDGTRPPTRVRWLSGRGGGQRYERRRLYSVERAAVLLRESIVSGSGGLLTVVVAQVVLAAADDADRLPRLSLVALLEVHAAVARGLHLLSGGLLALARVGEVERLAVCARECVVSFCRILLRLEVAEVVVLPASPAACQPRAQEQVLVREVDADKFGRLEEPSRAAGAGNARAGWADPRRHRRSRRRRRHHRHRRGLARRLLAARHTHTHRACAARGRARGGGRGLALRQVRSHACARNGGARRAHRCRLGPCAPARRPTAAGRTRGARRLGARGRGSCAPARTRARAAGRSRGL
mmetsp:Transcript_32524/g.76005  ORF Transcript_32524/g.76005 Transcript_32524/m.76005 type:complete len:322 (+) Transcript_32524:152-1117(+)